MRQLESQYSVEYTCTSSSVHVNITYKVQNYRKFSKENITCLVCVFEEKWKIHCKTWHHSLEICIQCALCVTNFSLPQTSALLWVLLVH